jgi:FkbM family methyltransferase
MDHNQFDPLSGDSLQHWLKDEGDRTHRVLYELDEQSIVLDLGGYRGQWANEISVRYRSHLHIFEPVPEFVNQIRKRFEKNNKIKVYPFGLSNERKNETIYLANDATSTYVRKGEPCKILLIPAEEFFLNHNLMRIDLMKINIEGGEYDLLEHMIAMGLIHKISNIQVQFHRFVPNAKQRMRNIQNHLAKSHELTYQYFFVWENWKQKNT